MTNIAFGDSITKGDNAPKPFPAIVADAKGWAIINNGINGAQAADCADLIYTTPVAAGDVSILAVGENDQRTANGDATKLTLFGKIHKALTAFLAIPNSLKTLANSAAVIRTGNWLNVLWGFGLYTNEANATVTFIFSGTTVYIGTILSDPWTGTYTISVDGNVVYAGSSAGQGKIQTVYNRLYAPYLIRLSGFSAGNHTVVIRNTSSGGGTDYIAFDWASAPSAGSKVLVGEIGKCTASGYATYGGYDANVDAFNKEIGQGVGELFGDGLDVHIVPAATVANSDLSDGLHPTQAGYQKIANSYLSVINNF